MVDKTKIHKRHKIYANGSIIFVAYCDHNKQKEKLSHLWANVTCMECLGQKANDKRNPFITSKQGRPVKYNPRVKIVTEPTNKQPDLDKFLKWKKENYK